MAKQGSGVRGQGSVKPDQIVVTFRMVMAIAGVPEEQLRQANPVAAMKEWAAAMKADLENDPDFGSFIKIEISVEGRSAVSESAFPAPGEDGAIPGFDIPPLTELPEPERW